MKRRAMVTLAALVVVAAVTLAAATIATSARALAAHSHAVTNRSQARSLAFSGAAAIATRLAEQRESLIAGAAPDLPDQLTLFTDDFGRSAVARVRSIKPEAARVHLNTASPPMLAALPGLDEASAGRIAAARPIATIEHIKTLAPSTDTQQEQPLIELVTVLADDPELAAGVSDTLPAAQPRLPLAQALTALTLDALSDTQKQALRDSAESGSIQSRAHLITALGAGGITPEQWGPLLDAVSFTDAPAVAGRIDINRAPAAVLAALPGIDADAAREIVDTRPRLDARTLRSISWPVEHAGLSPTAFAKAADHLTTRSTQWRLVIETGFIEPTPSGTAAALDSRVVLEVVYDLAAERPAIARLIDITLAGMTPPSSIAIASDTEDQPTPESPRIQPAPAASRVSSPSANTTQPTTRVGRTRVWGGRT